MTTQQTAKDLLLRRVPEGHGLRDFTVDPDTGCWIAARRGPNGYAYNTSFRGRKGNAYRLIWEIVNDRQLAGGFLEVCDHICENGPGGCVNPDHLKVTTQRDNTLRSTNGQPCADYARQTHCKRGHPFDEENTLISKGRRHCRACRKETQARWLANNPGRARELQKKYEATEHYKQKRRARQARYREAKRRVSA